MVLGTNTIFYLVYSTSLYKGKNRIENNYNKKFFLFRSKMNMDARLLLLRKPTEEHKNFWLYEEDPKIARQCPHLDHGKGGKWMMFFDSNDIDDKWELAVNYYRQGHLPGIHTLKVRIVPNGLKKTILKNVSSVHSDNTFI